MRLLKMRLMACCAGRAAPAGGRWQAAASAQEQAQLAPPLQIPDLNFTVDQFFCVGRLSPVIPSDAVDACIRRGAPHSICPLSKCKISRPGLKTSHCHSSSPIKDVLGVSM